jgi:hypothetical protein
MRYRQLTSDNDYTFGAGQLNFLIDSPAAVAQAVLTSLLLFLGEWYLNTDDGTPYFESALGKHSQEMADAMIIARISQVQGVVDVRNLVSAVDPNTRAYRVLSATINTIYGVTELEVYDYGLF